MRLRPSPRLVHGLLWPLHRSLRYHYFGTAHLRQAARLSATGTFMACFWHQSLLTLVSPHTRYRVAALASLSGDGQIIADYLKLVGLRPVRGSSARGAVHAARELMEAVHDGFHLAIAVDGPKGPFKEVKAGPLELARRHGVPIVPIGVRATRDLCFKRSWDRFRLPLPRADVAICYGSPLLLPSHDPTPAELDERRRALGRAINALEERASRLAGRSDDVPPPSAVTWLGGNAVAADRPG